MGVVVGGAGMEILEMEDDVALSLAISNSVQGIQRVAGDQSGLDLAVARSLQEEYDKEVFSHHQKDPTLSLLSPHTKPKTHSERKSDRSIVSREMELRDPNPDIHQLFVEFDAMFFWGKLVAGGVAVSWSDRMTL